MAELKIKADSGGGTVSFKGPATTTSNAAVQLTLPVDDGTANQVLTTNGSGALSWAAPVIADDSLTEAKLDIHAAPSGTDKFLGYTSNGMEWATVPAGGITVADQWRLTTEFSGSAYITSNLERNDTTGFGKIGTGVSQVSGVFSFPDEGIWLVEMCSEHKISSADNRGFRPTIYVTTDDGSNWHLHDQRGGSAYNSSSSTYSSSTSSTIVDVTDKTQVKVKFYSGSINSSGVTRGSSTENSTSFTFIRLGDT